MPSYLVTGASRGLGYAFIRQFSSDPTNQVFGLVRNKSAADKKIAEDGLKNITIIEADIIDRRSLQAAKAQVEEVTGGSLDYLINNAAFLSPIAAFNSLTDFSDEPEVLDNELWTCFNTNVVGVINTINAFLPLIQKSQVKKVISISTGFADTDLTADFGVYEAAPYSISKAALNMASAKYAARHGKDGILFLAISPGIVATGNGGAPPDSELPQKFARYSPQFKGPISPEESVRAVMAVVEASSVANGDGGKFLSHLGNKQWI